MTKNMKCFLIFGALLTIGTVLFAQSAESDFAVIANADGTVTITKYEGWDSRVTIPAAIGGKAVTAIGEKAFAKQDNLTDVTIPDSVTSIGEGAFSTNKLTGVTFGKGIVSIGSNAFYNNSLTSVTLPDTIKFIGVRAFSHNLLAKITIPGFNTYIGKFAFARNKQLTSVTLGSLFTFDNDSAYDGDTSGWISFTSFVEDDRELHSKGWDTNDIGERGKNLFWDYVCNDRKAGSYTPDLKYRAPKKEGDFEYVETKYGAALTKYNGTSTSLQLPEKAGGLAVKHIDTSIFERKNVDRVRIPNGITSIGKNVFYEKDLTSVAIADSVIYIGDKAFAGWSKLTSATLGKGVVIIRPSAFYNQKLTSVIMPDNVTYIGDKSFSGNKLTSMTIPDSVTYIGDSAFSSNTLISVTIGSGITSIGKGKFSRDNGYGSLTSVIISNSVTSIEGSAFYGNKLTSVIIPDSVTSIGDSAFEDNELMSVAIPQGVTYIGKSAFEDNELTSVVIPDSVTSIEDSVFEGNELTSLTIGRNVVSIGARAFMDNQLTSIVIPDSVTSIGDSAFYYHNELTSVTIGSGVTLGFIATPFDDVYDSNGKKGGVYIREGSRRTIADILFHAQAATMAHTGRIVPRLV